MNSIFSDIFSIISPRDKRRFYSLTVYNILISILDILSLAAILFIIHFYTGQPGEQKAPFLPAWLTNGQSVTLALFFFILFLLKNVAAYVIFRRQYSFVYAVAAHISQTCMLNYLQGNHINQVHTNSAVYIRRIGQLPVEFAHYVLAGVQQIITEAALILLATAAILLYNAKLFAVVAVLLVPVTLITWLYVRNRLHSIRGGIKQSSETALQYLKEALAGFTESNIYGKSLFFSERYAQKQTTLNQYLARLQTIQGTPVRMMEVFAVFGLMVLIAVNKTDGGNTGLDVIAIGAFMAGAYKIIPGIVRIIGLAGHIKAYRFTVTELKEAMLAQQLQQILPVGQLRSVCFDNISFSYGDRKLLSNVNMQIRPGEMVGISSASGKGKTTIINLLLGFLKEDSGHICLNEKNAGFEERKGYWKDIAYVKQQNFLMNDTIEKNITLDSAAARIERLNSVIADCGLQSFVQQFPEGVQKIISENGKNISGGQRQRIAIARALYKDAGLIILDEPFNELDNASEAALMQHFKQLAQGGKMIILITHRQESLACCHKVFTIND